jgi:hypothetical protein
LRARRDVGQARRIDDIGAVDAGRGVAEVGGKFSAHVNKSLLGTDVKDLKEKDGSPLGQKVFDAAKAGSITTVSYNFPKPGTTDPMPKESFVTRVADQGCGVGYYK